VTGVPFASPLLFVIRRKYMSAKIISGTEVAKTIREELKIEVA
jgi:hypothetical protein